jgi:hypothetical protein
MRRRMKCAAMTSIVLPDSGSLAEPRCELYMTGNSKEHAR